MHAAEIGEALTRLAVARGGLLGETESDVYLDRLQRFDAALVSRACAEWSDIARGQYDSLLPSVGQLIATIERISLDDATRASAARLLPMPQDEVHEPRYACPTCQDGYWVTRWCPGNGAARAEAKPAGAHWFPTMQCGRRGAHALHTWAERCVCIDVNPVIAAQRQRQREAVERRAKQ
jgi:hypothetical protein